MNRAIGPWILAVVVALGAPVLMAWQGVSVEWGAHPWWAMKTAIIGAGAGLGLGLVLYLLPKASGSFIALAFAFVAYATARYGGTEFAASYAEDAFAGRLWYLGWIAVAMGGSAFLLVFLAPRQI